MALARDAAEVHEEKVTAAEEGRPAAMPAAAGCLWPTWMAGAQRSPRGPSARSVSDERFLWAD